MVHLQSGPDIRRFVGLYLPPAYPAQPAEYRVEPNAANCRMFEKCFGDTMNSTSLVRLVSDPGQVADGCEDPRPQVRIEFIDRLCISQW